MLSFLSEAAEDRVEDGKLDNVSRDGVECRLNRTFRGRARHLPEAVVDERGSWFSDNPERSVLGLYRFGLRAGRLSGWCRVCGDSYQGPVALLALITPGRH